MAQGRHAVTTAPGQSAGNLEGRLPMTGFFNTRFDRLSTVLAAICLLGPMMLAMAASLATAV